MRLETSVGTVLAGRYRIESTLGSGGMAVVYRAEDDILGRAVALKTLHHHFAEVPSFRRRFRQEARAMASLDHENIVKVYDISQDGEVPFIVVECARQGRRGPTRHRRGGRLNEQFVRRIASSFCSRSPTPTGGASSTGHQAFQHPSYAGRGRQGRGLRHRPLRRGGDPTAEPVRSWAAPATCP